MKHGGDFDPAKIRDKIEKLEKESCSDGFWNDRKNTEKISEKTTYYRNLPTFHDVKLFDERRNPEGFGGRPSRWCRRAGAGPFP